MNENDKPLILSSRPVSTKMSLGSVTLKWRLIVTVIIGSLYLLDRYYHAKSISYTQTICMPGPQLVFVLIVTLGPFVVMFWNIVYGFKMWRSLRAKVLLPIVVGFPFIFLVDFAYGLGLNSRIETFKQDMLPGFQTKAEAVVQLLKERPVKKGVPIEETQRFGEHEGYVIYATTGKDRETTVRFLRVITMNCHHLGYMYRRDGKFESAISEKESITSSINGQWCAIRD